VAGKVQVQLAEAKVTLDVATRYPWDGAVALTTTLDQPARFRLRLRVPGWARGEVVPSDLYRFVDAVSAAPTLKINGEDVALSITDGYTAIEREWRSGDRVEFGLPMPVRRLAAHEAVADCRGKVALQRGPLVYCVEGVDASHGHVADLILDPQAELRSRARPDLFDGVTVIEGVAKTVRRTTDGLGREDGPDAQFAAIPYYAWAHRGRTEMAVWFAATAGSAIPGPAKTVAHRAKKSASHNGGLAAALADQMDVVAPGDKSRPFLHWWPKAGTVEWAQYDFDAETAIDGCEVYWLCDLPNGGCDYPESWRILYRVGEEWQPVAAKGAYGVEPAKFNAVEFAPVRTRGLRLEVQLKKDRAAGAHEWRLREAK
jgi:hypothetical protein